MTPLITIGIPTFNRAALVQETVRQSLAQTYCNIEVVVSDNASEDNTSAVLQAISDPRLRILRQSRNIGMFPNWNACLQAARGEFFLLLSDDDEIKPDFLHQCVGLLQSAGKELPMIVSLSDNKNTLTGYHAQRHARRDLNTGVYVGAELLARYLRFDISIQLCALLMRTETLRNRSGFSVDHSFAGDLATWAPLMLDHRVGFLNYSGSTYILHEQSGTFKLDFHERIADVSAVMSEISQRAQQLESVPARQKFKELTRRHLGRKILYDVTELRRGGRGLLFCLRLFWSLRRFFFDCSIRDLVSIFASKATLRILTPLRVSAAGIWLRDAVLSKNRIGLS